MNANHYNPQKLVEWREESGKTQEKIAEILGVDRNTISRAEKGKVASYDLLAGLCGLYKKSTHDLIYSKPVAIAA
ncbi:MAG TPA: helix-turn-helix transcriptional regulator [Pyrinomonadaceae bacterium]|jgi:transcriptional regulator with XRE-family HTH domain